MRDRAISTKLLTRRVSLRSSHPNFQKKICLTKTGGHFEFQNFSQKLQNTKNAYISKTVLDRAISTKFLIHRVYLQSGHPNFQKKFCLAPNGGNFEFSILKHKNAYISKTVLDRAILMKFLTHRVSLQSGHRNFQKKNCLTQNCGHFEFSNFSQKLQNTKMLISQKPC